jgi:hypothetical protein
MDESALVGKEWAWVETLLPSDLEESATAKLAIRRRREIGSASDLLRLALAYSVCDFSLRQTAAWASVIGLGQLSDVSVLKRLRGASEWMGHVVMQCLRERGIAGPGSIGPVRVVDATVVSKPGSTGTDWRIHLGLDLRALAIRSLELTGVEGGESFRRLAVEAGEIILGDRGYAHAEGLASVLDRGGHVVVRWLPHARPLLTRAGVAVDTSALLDALGDGEVGDWAVAFRRDSGLYPVRLVAIRKSDPATEKECRRIRHEATRKGRKVNPRTLHNARFIALVTDLTPEQLPARDVLELYRMRWLVEMAFKRLKSLLDLDRLRARDPSLARCYLYGKLLAALLLDDLCERWPALSPWGYPLFTPTRQPLAITATLD